jgi:PncC family amidohydrolase
MDAAMTVPTLDELTALARRVGERLLAAGLMAATAESCTGGLVGHLFTEIPGSSAYFAGGAITYSNDAKVRVLGVDPATLERVGAVSAETAAAMAVGARRLYAVPLAVSVTGVAGPGGGSPTKPVGLVHLHVSGAGDYERGARYVWPADRSGNKLLSAQAALTLILDYVDGRG